MSNVRVFACIAAMLVSGATTARADVVLPFSLQAYFVYTQSPPTIMPDPFSATLLINTTSGTIVDFQPPFFSGPMSVQQGPDVRSKTYIWSASPAYLPESITLDFDTPSLIGYTGGALVSASNPDSDGRYSFISEVHVPLRVLVSGSLTPLAVPEPSSLAILAAGAFGSGLIRFRRRRALLPGVTAAVPVQNAI